MPLEAKHLTASGIFEKCSPVFGLQDELVEQSSQGNFVSQGRRDILTTTTGTKEHPGRVRTAGFGVGVRQYFGSCPGPNTSTSFGGVVSGSNDGSPCPPTIM